ncbi:MAG: plastocyanin/azurin family copper-binding protein [Gammaproteobacteria bacterium]
MRGTATRATACGARIGPARVLVTAWLVLLIGACSDESATPTATPPEPPEPPSASETSGTVPADTGSAVTEPGAEPLAPATVEQPASPAATSPVDAERQTDTNDGGAGAEPRQHEIRGVVTQWGPLVTFAAPGDTIVFRQMTGHDTETLAGMIPEGAQGWKSALGEEGFSVTLSVPGAYVFKCNPHVSMGMVGAVIVGDTPPPNLAAIESSPQNKGMIGRAIRKLKEALNEH